MIPPAHAPDFLAAHGWEGCRILPLAGDASFRRYFRVHRANGETAVLMDAPPEHEDIGPFLTVAGHLLDRGFLPPRPLAIDRERGLLLLEDFGDDRVGPLLVREPELERAIYERAVDMLARLAALPAPPDLAAYDEPTMFREVALLTDWYVPTVDLDVDETGYFEAWQEAWAGVVAAVASRPVLVLRDYHADNLMMLADQDDLGLLDFQDALAGHPAYDLVSLLQDARRDVAPALEEAMIARFVAAAQIADPALFRAHYEILGAQRNAKIIGIFTRLWRRDGKPHYLRLQPRVWAHLERNLRHPALARVKAWFDANIPVEKRSGALAAAQRLQRQGNAELEELEARLAPASDRKVAFHHNLPDLEDALAKLASAIPVIERLNEPAMVEAAVHFRKGMELIAVCRERRVPTSVRIVQYLIIDPLKKALESSLEDAWKVVIQGALLTLLAAILQYLGLGF